MRPPTPRRARQPPDGLAPSRDIVDSMIERVALVGLDHIGAGGSGCRRLDIGADDSDRAVGGHRRQGRAAREWRWPGLHRDNVASCVGYAVHAGEQAPVRTRRLDDGSRAFLAFVHATTSRKGRCRGVVIERRGCPLAEIAVHAFLAQRLLRCDREGGAGLDGHAGCGPFAEVRLVDLRHRDQQRVDYRLLPSSSRTPARKAFCAATDGRMAPP